MRPQLCLALVPALLTACSSSSDGAASCKIDGVYTVSSKRISTTCDPRIGADGPPVDYTFTTRNGETVLALPNVGGACPVVVDGCTANVTCDITDRNGTLIGTYGAQFTFDGSGFKGPETAGFNPPVVPRPCQASFDSVGTRR